MTLASVSKAFTATAVALLIDDLVRGRNVTLLAQNISHYKIKNILPD
jgi:hypothetical protein